MAQIFAFHPGDAALRLGVRKWRKPGRILPRQRPTLFVPVPAQKAFRPDGAANYIRAGELHPFRNVDTEQFHAAADDAGDLLSQQKTLRIEWSW